MVFSHPRGRLKLFPSDISKQVVLLNTSLCPPDCGSFDAQIVKSTALVISSLCKAPISALSLSQAFSEPLDFQVQFSFWCAYYVVGFSCLEPFLYLYVSSTCLYSVTAFLPRKPLCTKESGIHPMRPAGVFTELNAYSWPIHFSPNRPELVGGRTSICCRMISVASGSTKLCNQRMNISFKC